MRERTEPNIAIKRTRNGSTTTIAIVPITDKSVRRFMLMQEDCVVLNFDLATPVELKVGDFIEDDIFGKFVLTKQQMPSYSVSNAAYQHNVTFEAEYRRWANYKFMLTEELNQARYRKEVNWTLTADLAMHTAEIINNLVVIGESGYSVSIGDEAIHQDEVKCVTYDSTDIISAMNMMAEEWSCEWWVVGKVINFGKCERTREGTPVFTLGDAITPATCESITAQEDQQTYANRLYVFGSTRNVPDTYDRELVFQCSSITSQRVGGTTLNIFRDNNRPMRASYIKENEQGELTNKISLSKNFQPNGVGSYKSYQSGTGIAVASEAEYRLRCNCTLTSNIRLNNGSDTSTINISVILTDGTTATTIHTQTQTDHYIVGLEDTYTMRHAINFDKNVTLTVGDAAWRVYITVDIVGASYTRSPYLENNTDCFTFSFYSASKPCVLTYNGNQYNVHFNPFGQAAGEEYWNYFAFDGDNLPSGFAEGSTYQLTPLSVNVPLSYWSRTDTDDPSAIAKIGEKRLHMDNSDNETSKQSNQGFEYYKGNGYIELEGIDPSEVVEQTIILDEEYPRCSLVVTSVHSEDKSEKVENRDGSVEWRNWVQYTITVELINGDEFPFNNDYILDGDTLKMKFLTNTEVEDERTAIPPAVNGARLSGMTFDVAFDEARNAYTIIRNEDYGARLPNNELCPKVGDALILLGWNVNAMSSLGLVDIAEASLEAKGVEYLQAINDNQFTFTCKMMSDFPFKTSPDNLQFDVLESTGSTAHTAFYEDTGKRFYVKNRYDISELLTEGDIVTIEHAALKGGETTSRIIGYELKLDKPYDTPQYTIGETAAYSRIKQLEKEIKRQ